MNNVQLKRLRELLAKKRSRLLDAFYYSKDIHKPQYVLTAERVIKAWEEENRTAKSNIYEQINDLVEGIETQAIFGGKNQEVLDALQKLDDWRPAE